MLTDDGNAAHRLEARARRGEMAAGRPALNPLATSKKQLAARCDVSETKLRKQLNKLYPLPIGSRRGPLTDEQVEALLSFFV